MSVGWHDYIVCPLCAWMLQFDTDHKRSENNVAKTEEEWAGEGSVEDLFESSFLIDTVEIMCEQRSV